MDRYLLINTKAWLEDSFVRELRAMGNCGVLHLLEGGERQKYLERSELMVCSGGSKAPRDLIESMPRLRQISVYGVGYDGIDVKACRERGIMVTNTPGVMKEDVADTAVGLLLNCARRLTEAHKYVESGAWMKGPMPLSFRISGMRVGIAGMGRIGLEAARRFEAFGCPVAYFATHRHEDLPYEYFDSLVGLAAWARALILILPGGPSTFHICDAGVLKALGPKGFLVNVGRGSLVDQRALIAALDDGTIAGCGLDVFENEPCLPPELINRGNVALCPHAGSATFETRGAMADMVLMNLRAYLAGKAVPTPVPELA